MAVQGSGSPVNRSLEAELRGIDSGLQRLLLAIAESVASVSQLFQTSSADKLTGGVNPSGDKQLLADLQADEVIFRNLKESGVVSLACSEEQPDVVHTGGSGYCVAFDPLDGSSIYGANWAVGSIFGVWPGDHLIGRTGREQSAAAYALYGPKTLLVVARPDTSGGATAPLHAHGRNFVAQEFVLCRGKDGAPHEWVLSKERLSVKERKVFAPANMRCAADNEQYRQLLAHWIESRYTLRYSGGMVPDVHHVLIKGGVFCSPSSPSAAAKLRLLFECAPMSLIVEAAGGRAICESGPLLDKIVEDTDQRTTICVGSGSEVDKCRAAMGAPAQ
ncbi:unnamed protein product [Pedinophyceae sp. YPF-701]|nr:unnamed protein product [Pedinophyceae sp. YPF-701]